MKKNSLASRLVTTITVVAITSVAFAASPASAQVNVTPAADGPGAAQIQRVLNWLAQYALWSGLAAVIFGAGWMGWTLYQGRQAGSKGQMAIMGGGLGALVVGFAPAMINTLSSAQ